MTSAALELAVPFSCVISASHYNEYTSKDLFESVVLVSTYYQSGVSTSVSKRESSASDASTDDKTATIIICDQISHALSNIHDLYGCSCILNVISIYSLNSDKLPGHFSYQWPRYKANALPDVQIMHVWRCGGGRCGGGGDVDIP